jgi:hypothetical protein
MAWSVAMPMPVEQRLTSFAQRVFSESMLCTLTLPSIALLGAILRSLDTISLRIFLEPTDRHCPTVL